MALPAVCLCGGYAPGKDTSNRDSLTVENAPLVEGTRLTVTFAPKDPKDNATPFANNINQQGKESRVFSGTMQVPVNAKGSWYLRDVSMGLPVVGGNNPITTNQPEFTVKPIVVTLPTKGTAEITVP